MSQEFSINSVLVGTLIMVGCQALPAEARDFRVSLIPNGSENRCVNCHFNPGGGGPRNPFGQDVNSLVSPGSRTEFWSLNLAGKDSDNDGFTNGEELGDLDGDGIPERTVNISLPGSASSSPTAALGDCNLDTVLDADDLSCVGSIEARDAVLTGLGTLPGDLDGNGDVAFADFLVLSNSFGQDLPAYTDGNIDLSGSIDFADFLIMSTNYGKSAATLSSVPEADGGLLAVMGFLFMFTRRAPTCRAVPREAR